ncbi:ATP-dependent DNA helicase 2 subunit KU80, partial [Cucurbita argyrosperma subsp. argyrosperma]
MLIYSKYDEVGIVLFGTKETKNELTEEVGGYQHVVVLQNMKVVDGDLVDVLKRLPRGTVSGDCIQDFAILDAIIVGMDMLIKKFGETEKGKKRLCLITDALFPIKEPYEGTKEDQVSAIAQQMTKHGMRMDSVVVRRRFGRDADEKMMDENDVLLNIFSEKTNAKMVYVESPTSLLGAIRTRSISPVTIYRGDLEISSVIKIKVWVYKKTSEEKFPTLKRYSDKAPSTDKFATHEVKVDYEYKSAEDTSKVVPPEHRIKGYRYGPQVIPISTAEWDAVKFKPEKSVKLLGFTNASNIMRHYYMKDVNVFIAEPGNKRAIVAVSALARAMKELDKVAIVRCVWRQGQGSVVVGVLTPNISEKNGIADSLYFNVLPFAEDVREFQFPSFNNFPALMQPSEEQQEAADEFVKMLDLAPSGREEILQPDFTPNPVLEVYLYVFFVFSNHSDTQFTVHSSERHCSQLLITQLVELLHNCRAKCRGQITEPDPDLLSQNKSGIGTFNRRFELKENPKVRTSMLLSICLFSFSRPQTLRGIKTTSMFIQEPTQFNDFLRHLCKFCLEKNLHSFCELLAFERLSLISKKEAADSSEFVYHILNSEVADDEARSFLVKMEPKFEPKMEPKLEQI